jgi:hypothetical protein
MSNRCDFCGKECYRLCGKCGAPYCGKVCQETDHPKHKGYCRPHPSKQEWTSLHRLLQVNEDTKLTEFNGTIMFPFAGPVSEPVPKCLWVVKDDPEAQQAIRAFKLPKEITDRWYYLCRQKDVYRMFVHQINETQRGELTAIDIGTDNSETEQKTITHVIATNEETGV